MKLLLDTCVPSGVRDALLASHDVEWCGDWPFDPGDEEILSRARQDQRVVVTLDKDFGELAVVRGVEHAGIVRLVSMSIGEQSAACGSALLRYGDQLIAGAIVTVERGRVRVRPRQDGG